MRKLIMVGIVAAGAAGLWGGTLEAQEVRLGPLELEPEPRAQVLKKKPKPAKTIKINCKKNKSINKALEDTAIELTIEISGICTEDVLVRRDNVTFLGSDPNFDGIQAESNAVDTPFGAALLIREARNIHVENLQLNGGWTGLRVENARRRITADNVILQGANFGAVSLGGRLDMANATITNNLRGIGASASAELTCNNCTVSNNVNSDGTGGIGIFLLSGAQLTFRDSSVRGSGVAAIIAGASLFATSSTLDATGNFALSVEENSFMQFTESSFTGGVIVETDSRFEMFGSTQSANPVLNFVSRNSTLRLADRNLPGGVTIPSALLGLTDFSEFSNGVVVGAGSVGDLTCSTGADVFCGGTIIKTSSSCGLCP